MSLRIVRVVLAVALGAMVSTLAYGQGGTTSTISGVVVDTGGGVVPGADVVLVHSATGGTQSAVSNAEGAFSFAGLNPGTYTVKVTLQGFKTFLANDVVLTSGAPANVRAVLEVGGLEETVVVSSTSEIIQAQAATVSSTINTNQITKLPLTSRSAMDFVTFLPGVSTPGGNRQSQINGLPRGLINITLDGVNIQDNTLRSTDGFFAIVSPRLDAIEEVTVTTAAQGADGSGQGAVQIKFVTRSGSNQFTGSGYHYYRSDTLNANTWFNNRNGVAKPLLKQNQTGVRVGGPIVLPKVLDGRNKAFFFVNYEELHEPRDVTRNRTILNPLAQQGIFSYATPGGIRQVNVLAVAAARGQLSTPDPLIAAVLGDIRSATGTTGSIADIDPNLQRFTYNVAVTSMRRFPTVRIDYNVTDRHRFSSAWNYNYFTDFPDTLNGRDAQFPGFPVAAGQSSTRIGWSNALRSTLGQNLVNEARVGYSGAPVTFFKELNTGMYTGSLANTAGFHLDFPTVGANLTNPGAGPAPQSRNATSLLIEDTLTWLRGSHSISMGGSWTRFNIWLKNSSLVPEIDFGVVTGDPAQSLFTGANAATFFPGASSANLSAATELYALITGRVSSVTGNARLNEGTNLYEYMGTGTQRARMPEAGFFLQDAWRLRPNLTLNAGVRYELQFPFYPLNSSYSTATMADLCGISGLNAQGRCNLFQPGVLTGKHPEFVNFSKGTTAYETDYDNIAPNVGFAWTVAPASSLLRALLSDEFVLRAGYTRAFNREGMNSFSGQFNQNPGVLINVNRNINLGNLAPLPLLFRDAGRLGPPPFSERPVYPMTDDVTQDVNIFDPSIQVPWAETWTAGIQRSVGRDMAVEVRYVGTRSRDNWQVLNFNEINIFDNGFVNEFRQAQANLQANIAAGRGANFRYFGPGTGTSPLPIMLAYFGGVTGAAVNDPARYGSGNFASNTFLTPLATFNPNPFGFAGNLFGNAGLRANASAAALPPNFFIVNPDLQGGADLTTNNGRTDYHSLQIELRRRLSQGLQFQTSYVFGQMKLAVFETHRRPNLILRDAGDPGDLTHAFKANAVYDLPFGRGRRFGGDISGFVHRIIGDWTIGVTSRVQSGRLIDLGNRRLVGMSVSDVEKMFNLRFDDEGKKVWMLPEDVIDNTIKAFSVSASSPTGYGTLGPPSGRHFAPANGPDCIEVDNGADYGDCAERSLLVTGPLFQQHDISIAKRVALVGRTNVEFRLEMLNAFNRANFIPVGGIGTQITGYEVTGLTGTNTSRVIQLVSRINW